MKIKFKAKCVTITPEQQIFLEEDEQENFKLSNFLQEKLWEYMRERDIKKEFVDSCEKEVK